MGAGAVRRQGDAHPLTSKPRAVAPPPSGEPWTVMHMVKWSASYLELRGVDSPRLTAELLLAHVLGAGRLDLYLQFDRPLTAPELASYKPLLQRRAAREPLQYVLGSTQFRGLDLLCDSRALIPRPETEGLLDALSSVSGQEGPVGQALDVGTGTGALALSMAHENMAGSVLGVDVSEDALDLARSNAARAGLESRVGFRRGSLFEAVNGEVFDWVVSNPPYVATDELSATEPEVREWEPRLALAGGADGLDVIRPLVAGAATVLRGGGWLALEVGWDQTAAVETLLKTSGEYASIDTREDLAGRPRYVLARRK